MNNDAKRIVLSKIASAFLDAVKDAGPEGAPAGPMYAAAMTYSMTLDQFEAIMDALVHVGKLRKSGHLYYAV